MFIKTGTDTVKNRAFSGVLLFIFTFVILVSPLGAQPPTSHLENDVAEHVQAANAQSTGNKTSDFVDKWLINGNAIGNSIGAVVGQSLVGLAFGGPVGLFLGSILGSTVGGYLGNMVDDRNGIAVNYTAFNRPPVTQGGIWLENVGPWEQFMYQFDAFVLNGGNIAGIGTNLLMNTMARTIPGLGSLANPILLTIVGYLAGCVADNIDGLIDLGLIGRRIDVARGQSATVGTTQADETYGDGPHGDLGEIDREFDNSYEEVIYHLRHGTVDSIKNAYEEFSNVSESAADVIKSHINDDK